MLLAIEAAEANIALMAGRFAGGTRLRPHGKSHKCAELAHRQIRAGAIGLTTATAWEAVAFVNRGIKDVLVANQVVGAEKVAALAAAAREARVTVAVDDAGHARHLAEAAGRAGSTFGVLVEVDVGLARCGVRTPEAAVQLAQAVARLPGLALRGVMGYEGHRALEPDEKARNEGINAAMARLIAAVEALAAAGFPAAIVSAGGTSTAAVTGRLPGITEIQAGSYVLMDNARGPVTPEFQNALTILATVVSRHDTTVVLDTGRKTIGLEMAAPAIAGVTATLRRSGDEHLVFELKEPGPLRVGDQVEVIPGYVPTTVNLHEAYLVMRGGVVVDVWPVLARGAGNSWVP
jgi:D-serine deaminase-like pyridoxal phosphate-dependent protein